MNQKLEELIATAKLNDLLHMKEEESKKKCNGLVCALAIIGVIAAVVAAVFAITKLLSPSYLDDDFDDFDDDFDDDFYSDNVFTIEDDE